MYLTVLVLQVKVGKEYYEKYRKKEIKKAALMGVTAAVATSFMFSAPRILDTNNAKLNKEDYLVEKTVEKTIEKLEELSNKRNSQVRVFINNTSKNTEKPVYFSRREITEKKVKLLEETFTSSHRTYAQLMNNLIEEYSQKYSLPSEEFKYFVYDYFTNSHYSKRNTSELEIFRYSGSYFNPVCINTHTWTELKVKDDIKYLAQRYKHFIYLKKRGIKCYDYEYEYEEYLERIRAVKIALK